MDSSQSKEFNDVYLAKWLDGKISDQDLKLIVSDDDFQVYKKIRESLDMFESPEFKTDRLKEITDKKPDQKNIKTRKLNTNWYYAAAAILVLFLSTYFYTTKTVLYATKAGEIQEIELPDGSEVRMNSSSEIRFSKRKWKDQRLVRLKGDAFFSVMKGEKFTVDTKNGKVYVLGTRFNINSQDNYLIVKCFSGRVGVIHNADTIFLTKGKAYQFNGFENEKWDFNSDKPAWFYNESVFKSTPLKIVIVSLENQFGVDIRSEGIDTDQIFTGSFNLNDLDIALKSVFLPMNIKYRIDNKTVFLSKK